jgi:HAD superfamily hydrolase (TIGR01509 family)
MTAIDGVDGAATAPPPVRMADPTPPTDPGPAKPGVTLEAVLFDLDGTMVDTEPYWIAAEFALVACFGGQWSQSHAEALVGRPLLVSAAYIREHGGVDLDPPEIVRRLLASVIAESRRHTPWKPGVLDLIGELRTLGVPCAMVTMSYRPLAMTIAEQLPEGTFGAIVTGDEVRNGKPDPEAYLTAAERLGVDIRQCVAIEDSPTGAASAQAAGCAVIGVPSHTALPPAPGRTVLASLEGIRHADLCRILAGHLAGHLANRLADHVPDTLPDPLPDHVPDPLEARLPDRLGAASHALTPQVRPRSVGGDPQRPG